MLSNPIHPSIVAWSPGCLNGFTQAEAGAESNPGPPGGTMEEPTPVSNVQTPCSIASQRIESAAQKVPPKKVVPLVATRNTGEIPSKSEPDPDRSSDSILDKAREDPRGRAITAVGTNHPHNKRESTHVSAGLLELRRIRGRYPEVAKGCFLSEGTRERIGGGRVGTRINPSPQITR